ncbi:unnamed protein product [Pleuronectes platessa]|uniref:Uncharacterized protein n=1 Tax=Pleuronectes platessa TaxID=8262 RepID=A0A9N7YVD4_PLEPL|nr:unnamed protein product [Pleuronectes platessa]
MMMTGNQTIAGASAAAVSSQLARSSTFHAPASFRFRVRGAPVRVFGSALAALLSVVSSGGAEERSGGGNTRLFGGTIRGFATEVRAENQRYRRRGQQGTVREEYMRGGLGEGAATTAAVPPRSKFTQTRLCD